MTDYRDRVKELRRVRAAETRRAWRVSDAGKASRRASRHRWRASPAGLAYRRREKQKELKRIRNDQLLREQINASLRDYRASPEGQAKTRAYERSEDRKAQRRDEAYLKRQRERRHERMLDPSWRTGNAEQRREGKQRRRAMQRGQLGIVSRGIKAMLQAAQSNKCAFCSVKLEGLEVHLDHIQPLARGGMHEDANLQVLCAPCNMSKGAKDPIQFAQAKGKLL